MRRYSGGSPAMDRSISRIEESCSSTRAASSLGTSFSSPRHPRARHRECCACGPPSLPRARRTENRKACSAASAGRGAVVAGPAHVALNALAKGFLRHADLDRTEARFTADFRRDGLIDRRSSGAVAGEGRTRCDPADRFMVAVAGAAGCRRLIIQTTEHVDIVAERSQRVETRRKAKIGAGLAWDPIAFGNAVAIEPEDEAALDGLLAAVPAAYAVPVELNILTSGGSPTCTALPASVNPLRNLRRETRNRLAITCDITALLPRETPART